MIDLTFVGTFPLFIFNCFFLPPDMTSFAEFDKTTVSVTFSEVYYLYHNNCICSWGEAY